MFSLCSLVLCNNRSNAVFVIASQSGMLRARMCVFLAYSVANFGAIFEIELVLVAGYEKHCLNIKVKFISLSIMSILVI